MSPGKENFVICCIQFLLDLEATQLFGRGEEGRAGWVGQSWVWWGPRGRAGQRRGWLACPGQQGRGRRSGKGRIGAGWCGAGRTLIRCSRVGAGGPGGGALSDVGLGVPVWLDGVCRDCTRRAAAAALAEPPSSHHRSLLASKPPGGAGWAAAVRVMAAEICYCGNSNSLGLS